ncbi:hypothetical protein [Mesorhizobium sp. M0019]|uniref:hypothetical protein n=1 Tax=Mesorhizobium sp. M0019 TaxID=2956845 RepID=UPI00333B1A07
MTRSPDAPVPPDQAQQALQCLTTEHFVLQNARAATIQEANQRADLFLTSVSSATIALSFVAQVTEMGRPFVLFSLILLPCLFFIGLVTFVRAVQVAIEDMVHARGMPGSATISLSWRPCCKNTLSIPRMTTPRRCWSTRA